MQNIVKDSKLYQKYIRIREKRINKIKFFVVIELIFFKENHFSRVNIEIWKIIPLKITPF